MNTGRILLFFREVPGWGYAEKKECLSFAVSRAAQTVAHVKKIEKDKEEVCCLRQDKKRRKNG